jgi:hypothetical protein
MTDPAINYRKLFTRVLPALALAVAVALVVPALAMPASAALGIGLVLSCVEG